jgi:hypothetical protein
VLLLQGGWRGSIQNPILTSVGFEPSNLGTRGQHANP